MKQNLIFSLFLLLALLTALDAVAYSSGRITYNGINYILYYSGSGESAVAEYALVSTNSSFSGVANIEASVTYEYTYVSGYDDQGAAVYATRNLTAPVTSIGYCSFENCTDLTSVTIPNSVIYISGSAFRGCTGLTSVFIPNSVTSIGDLAFNGCIGLTNMTIPNSVTSIGCSAFRGCAGLSTVIIPNSVTSIGERAFQECSGLTNVTIPNTVTTLALCVFAGSGLTSVDIPNSVISIGDGAFSHCGNLTSISIPNSVIFIGNQAFNECTNLTNLTIPNSVVTIDDYAFYNCSSLTSVAIPNSVSTIGSYAFGACFSLMSATISNSVTAISDGLFSSCKNLTSVTIPNNISIIGNSAFNYCKSLMSVTIPNSVTAIGDKAFYYCRGLTTIIIPNSVNTIGEYAFYNCNGLTSVTCHATTPPSAGYSSFESSYSSATLHVPSGSFNQYQMSEPWKYFYSIQPIGQDYSILLDQTSAVIEKGDFIQLHATVVPQDGFEPSVTWSSSNTSVATVDEWGIVTAVATGTATITAQAGNTSATCSVRVVQHTVTLDMSSVSIPLFSTVQLHATVTPDDEYAPSVEWSSSRPGVATVTSSGLVKGYMTGTATITAKAGQSTATCVVTVTPILATDLVLNAYQEEMNLGQIFTLVATVYPGDASNKNVSWFIPENDVVSCSLSGNECIIIAEKPGNVTITATTTDGTDISKSCVVTVKGGEPIIVYAESITLDHASITLNAGTIKQLYATILPTNTTNKNVAWSSSDENVATVTSHGVVRGYTPGTAIITASTTDGTNLTAQCIVTVIPEGGSDPLIGDVDGDGRINIDDVTALINYLLKGDTSSINLENADVDNDGRININDVTALINMLLSRS